MLKFYSSSTRIVNTRRAISECLENALEGEPNLDCDLIIIYTAMGHNFNDLLDEAHKLSPNARITGSTCAGVIGREGPDQSMKALAIMAIKGGKNEFAIAARDSIVNTDLFDMGAQLAQDLKNQNPNINMLLFVPSGMDVFPSEKAIEGIESVFGTKIPICGGTSADNFKGISNFQFMDDQILERGAIMVGFADPTLEIITQVNHGFKVIGEPFEVTCSEGNHIYEFNGKPAWKFLIDALGVEETIHPFELAVVGQLAEELPEEFHEEYGSKHILRCTMGHFEDDSIIVPVAWQEGTKVWLTERDEKGIFDGVDRIVKQVLNRLDGKKPVAVFHTDCATRGRKSFNQILKEEIINRLQYPICGDDNIPWLGSYGYAEFAMLGGLNRIHQFTSALFVLFRHIK